MLFLGSFWVVLVPLGFTITLTKINCHSRILKDITTGDLFDLNLARGKRL